MFRNVVTTTLKAVSAMTLVCLMALGGLGQNSSEWSLNVSPLPPPTGPVNDYVGVLDEQSKASLNQKLIDFQRSSGVELAVAIVDTTGDRPIADYSLAVYRGWGIGAKADDNPGALLLIAVNDRKYFTLVGSNLEDELPDAVVGNLQRQYLVPELRNGNYAKAINDTLDAYIRTYQERSSGTAASPTPVPGREGPGRVSQGASSAFCCILIAGVILLIILSNRGGRSGGGRRGGWGGGFGGGGSVIPWIIGSAIANAASSSSSSSSDWGSGWGGGGDWGGGGWGGFGGGGDAGGGGAGGGW